MKKYPGVIQCLKCKRVLVSNFRHDVKSCGCPNQTIIDGGYDYLKVSGKDLAKIQVLKLSKASKAVRNRPGFDSGARKG